MREWELGKVLGKVGVKLNELVGATFTLWYGMLLYSMQCYVCYAMLGYAMKFLAVPGCAWLHLAVQCYPML